MNLLIIDDEISSIRAVSGMLDWNQMGIDKCFTALSAQEARDCISHKAVDILLCDIEMPQESGLELLAWVNAQGFDITCIYMTCYAEFSYAQRAMNLGSMAYLLKPIDPEELERAIRAAVKKRQEQQRHNTLDVREDKLVQQFWLDLFYEEIPSDTQAIAKAIEDLRLPLYANWQFCTCLVVVRDWGADQDRTHRLNRYGVHNVVKELFRNEARQLGLFHTVFPFGQHGQMCLCGGESANTLEECCCRFAQQYLSNEERYLKVRSVCYVGQSTPIEDAAGEMERLMHMDNSSLKNHGLLVHSREPEPALADTRLDARFERWANLLEGGMFDTALQEIEGYLSSQEGNAWFDKRKFRYFLSGYAGILAGYAERHKFPLKELTESPQNADLFERSDRSAENMRAWVECSLRQLGQRRELGENDPVRDTKAFVAAHISEELDVAKIAENVHLNQDYLTRIFHRETGVSVKSFIVACRMEMAKELLETTRLPIADVAYRVGYSNYTSFNRAFKKSWGISPQDHKKQS